MMLATICIRSGLLVLAAALLAACTPAHYADLGPGPVAPPASFAHRAADANVELFWNCSQPQPQVMRLIGAARNAGQGEVRSILLTARSVKLGDAPLLVTAEALPEIILYASGPSPFQVDLQLEKTPTRIDLSAVYQVTPDVSAPSSVGPQGNLAADDICAPSRYPNPLYQK
jgi:hypothetical protein